MDGTHRTNFSTPSLERKAVSSPLIFLSFLQTVLRSWLFFYFHIYWYSHIFVSRALTSQANVMKPVPWKCNRCHENSSKKPSAAWILPGTDCSQLSWFSAPTCSSFQLHGWDSRLRSTCSHKYLCSRQPPRHIQSFVTWHRLESHRQRIPLKNRLLKCIIFRRCSCVYRFLIFTRPTQNFWMLWLAWIQYQNFTKPSSKSSQ